MATETRSDFVVFYKNNHLTTQNMFQRGLYCIRVGSTWENVTILCEKKIRPNKDMNKSNVPLPPKKQERCNENH